VKSLSLWTGPPSRGGVKMNSAMDVCFIRWENNGNDYTLPLSTLANPNPTMAVMAFDSLRAPGGSGPNPAGAYCSQFGGTTAGHVLIGEADWYVEVEPGVWDENAYDFCVFPDFSAIGQWTLFYHSNGQMGNNIKWGWSTRDQYPNLYSSPRE